MVKRNELNDLITKFSQIGTLISKVKRIDSLGESISVRHPITRKMVDLPIPPDEKQKALNKLKAIKEEVVDLIQSINWSKIE